MRRGAHRAPSWRLPPSAPSRPCLDKVTSLQLRSISWANVDLNDWHSGLVDIYRGAARERGRPDANASAVRQFHHVAGICALGRTTSCRELVEESLQLGLRAYHEDVIVVSRL